MRRRAAPAARASARSNLKGTVNAFLKTLACLIALFIVVGIVVGFAKFTSTSVCDRCGARLRAWQYQLPLTSITFREGTTVVPTPMSSVLAAKGIITNCSHHFVFCTGSGNGVKCAIGPGRHILPTALSTNMAALIGNLARYSGQTTARTFATILLQTPPASQGTLETIFSRDFPDAGFKSEGHFRSWWIDRQQDLEELEMSSRSEAAPK